MERYNHLSEVRKKSEKEYQHNRKHKALYMRALQLCNGFVDVPDDPKVLELHSPSVFRVLGNRQVMKNIRDAFISYKTSEYNQRHCSQTQNVVKNHEQQKIKPVCSIDRPRNFSSVSNMIPSNCKRYHEIEADIKVGFNPTQSDTIIKFMLEKQKKVPASAVSVATLVEHLVAEISKNSTEVASLLLQVHLLKQKVQLLSLEIITMVNYSQDLKQKFSQLQNAKCEKNRNRPVNLPREPRVPSASSRSGIDAAINSFTGGLSATVGSIFGFVGGAAAGVAGGAAGAIGSGALGSAVSAVSSHHSGT